MNIQVKTGELASAKALIYALRNPEIWPKGFTWDCNDFHHCAIALTFWLSSGPPGFVEDNPQYMQSLTARLGISEHAVRKTLLSPWPYAYRVFGVPVWFRPWRKITPEMVADVLEARISA